MVSKGEASICKIISHLLRLIEHYTFCHSTLELDLLHIDKSTPNYAAEITEVIRGIPLHKRTTLFNLLKHSFSISEEYMFLINSHQNWLSLFQPEDFGNHHDVEMLIFQAKSKKVSLLSALLNSTLVI